MKYTSYLALSVIPCLALHCAPTSEHANKNLPGWADEKVICHTIGIKLLPSNPFVSCPEIVNKCFGQWDATAAFRSALLGSLSKCITDKTECVRSQVIEDSIDVMPRSLQVSKKLIVRMKVPRTKLTSLKSRGIDYLLMLEDCSLNVLDVYNKPQEGYIKDGLMVHDTRTQPRIMKSKVIHIFADYLIVDCENGDFVEYGQIISRTANNPLDKADFEEGIAKLAKFTFRYGALWHK
jgi:hypothetical protein